MINRIDNFLNGITMYRLVLYSLILLLVCAALLGFLGILPLNPFDLIFSCLFLVIFCWAANIIFAKAFKAPTNVESVYISAFILALIISPIASYHDLPFLFWASILAMASKYILAINKKHIFNPVAVGVAVTAAVLGESAGWWVGTLWMAPLVLITGFLIVRKIKRFDLAASFISAAFICISVFYFLNGGDLKALPWKIFFDTPLLFFAFIMLTEPLTTPPSKNLQIFYGALVGFLFAPQVHIGSVYSTPELALLAGNIFSYLTGPKEKLVLRLKEKIKIAPDIYDFLFTPDRKLKFQPGQYLEYTLGHGRADARGNRRYFTIASSPTEQGIRMGVKFYENGSSFKKVLASMKDGDEIMASQLAGDFILPKDKSKKLVFIAGGIGVTPFRSIIKYLLDTGERRDIKILYSTKTEQEIIYKDVFDGAQKELGIRIFYAFGGNRITEEMIKENIPDYKDRIFYLSGARSMILRFDQTLRQIGVAKRQIKTDFFPGFV